MSRESRHHLREQASAARRHGRVRQKWWMVGLVLCLLTAGGIFLHHQRELPQLIESQLAPVAPDRAANLLPSLPEAMTEEYIAYRNLTCAESLPGANGMDLPELLRRLDEWAERVRSETARHLYRYQQNPAEFDHSEAYYRMLMMAVVVAEDFGVRYNPELIGNGVASDDRFFEDSRNIFLHGLLGEQRLGTCSSMPVLYVALGRRLGYPVFLVATKGHLFVRWESPSERLNLEATGKGMNHYSDDHYRQWPFAITDAEIAENGYLKSMTPKEELAAFLSIRAACFRANGLLDQAAQSFAQAAALAPHCQIYRLQAGLEQSPIPVGLKSPAQGDQRNFNPSTPLPAAAGLPPDLNPLSGVNYPSQP